MVSCREITDFGSIYIISYVRYNQFVDIRFRLAGHLAGCLFQWQVEEESRPLSLIVHNSDFTFVQFYQHLGI